MKRAFLIACLAGALATGPDPVVAQTGIGDAGDVVRVEFLNGWREADGRHIAAIRLSLAQGWKTYWRAPGDGGLPTTLRWERSDNIADLRMLWPRPTVFDDGALRSIGYTDEVVLPLQISPSVDGDITLNARLLFGVCKDVCVPAMTDLRHVLSAQSNGGSADIRDAIAATPTSAADAGVHSISCKIEPSAEGHRIKVDLTADIEGTARAMVLETNDAEIWVGRTKLSSDGSSWHGVTHAFDHRDAPAELSPKDVRITLLTDKAAVDIQGCATR